MKFVFAFKLRELQPKHQRIDSDEDDVCVCGRLGLDTEECMGFL